MKATQIKQAKLLDLIKSDMKAQEIDGAFINLLPDEQSVNDYWDRMYDEEKIIQIFNKKELRESDKTGKIKQTASDWYKDGIGESEEKYPVNDTNWCQETIYNQKNSIKQPLSIEQKLILQIRKNKKGQEMLKIIHNKHCALSNLLQDIQNLIENLNVRYDLDQMVKLDDNESIQLHVIPEKISHHTILQNFKLREVVGTLRDNNWRIRNDIYETQDAINKQVLRLNKVEKSLSRAGIKYDEENDIHNIDNSEGVTLFIKNRNCLVYGFIRNKIEFPYKLYILTDIKELIVRYMILIEAASESLMSRKYSFNDKQYVIHESNLILSVMLEEGIRKNKKIQQDIQTKEGELMSLKLLIIKKDAMISKMIIPEDWKKNVMNDVEMQFNEQIFCDKTRMLHRTCLENYELRSMIDELNVENACLEIELSKLKKMSNTYEASINKKNKMLEEKPKEINSYNSYNQYQYDHWDEDNGDNGDNDIYDDDDDDDDDDHPANTPEASTKQEERANDGKQDNVNVANIFEAADSDNHEDDSSNQQEMMIVD